MTTFRSPLATFVVALSLIIQLFVAASPPAMAMSAPASADNAAIVAEFKGLFGDAAQLCVHINDDGSPTQHGPCHCCDQCLLCGCAAHVVAFVPPDLPALPGRINSEAHAIRAPPVRDTLPSYPVQPNPARAPPLAI